MGAALLALSDADAIVYLLRSLHASDVEFLRSLNERPGAETAMGAVAVLSRADELGAGRLNAMADVGKGVIDFGKVLDAAKRTGVRYAFVERDDTTDPVATIRSSRQHLTTLLAAR